MSGDVSTIPLRGHCLIEASAGTGKTYTITGLVLRLLLGAAAPGTPAVPARALREILIVTFTNAATEELRTRIRTRLHAARVAFERGEAKPDDETDELITGLLSRSDDPERDLARLRAAELELDLANILTIHGFANRVLNRNAFESGISFAARIAEDDAATVRREILDMWRERVYPLPPLAASLLLGRLALSDFLDRVPRLLGRQRLRLLNVPQADWERLVATVTAGEHELIETWRREAGALDEAQLGSCLNKKGRAALEQACRRMEAVLVGRQRPGPETVQALSREFLEGELDKRKGRVLPTLAIFDIAQELLERGLEMERRLIADALAELPQRLARCKERSELLGYDDLLRLLDEGLHGPSGRHLAQTIREQYPVALIDEFQDTDLRQWDVFATIYDAPDSALFLVGDPKQAIYAFRGADVHAYLRARATISQRRSLPKNHRSVAPLVAAINALFSLRSDGDPFLGGEAMAFLPVEASGRPERRPLLRDGAPITPLTVLHVTSDAPLPIGRYVEQSIEATANHLCALLEDAAQGRVTLGGEPLKPAHVACLVRTHDQAQHFATACSRRGIPTVSRAHDSVYATREAHDLYQLLAAVLEPGSERLLRAALGCTLLGRSAAELEGLCGDDASLEREQARFIGLSEELCRNGVQSALRSLLFAYDVPARLLAHTDGERSLTNCLHLIELLQAERERLNCNEALLPRFVALMSQSGDRSRGEREAELLRLASDAERVQIVTLHACKGLEYPVVYLPLAPLFQEPRERLFHCAATHELCYDLAEGDEALAQAARESLAEDVRLFYVGVTRAIHCCVLGMGDVTRGSSKESRFHHSAPGHLLDAATTGAAGAIERLGSIPGVSMLDAAALRPCVLDAATTTDAPLHWRTFATRIERDWQASSYSALARHLAAASDEPFRQPELRAEATAVAPVQEHGIFTFPRGARHGSFLHGLFEKIDPATTGGTGTKREMLAESLLRDGYAPDWLPVMEQLLDDVLDCALDDGALRLRSLPPAARIAEMGFEFPLHRLEARRLNTLLAAHEPLARRAPPLTFPTVHGMLSGFIDLVFEYQGRYYIADYKSNHLGDRLDDYTPERLQASIAEHRYDLQYTLYTLALSRLLAQRLGADFDYDRHIGGVYYLYLRGMRAAAGPRHGVWHARPSRELIGALDTLLGGENRGDC